GMTVLGERWVCIAILRIARPLRTFVPKVLFEEGGRGKGTAPNAGAGTKQVWIRKTAFSLQRCHTAWGGFCEAKKIKNVYLLGVELARKTNKYTFFISMI
ncbi:MAG: hypothetical protein R3Y55_07035, partial [Rikenellaceae bacterium]